MQSWEIAREAIVASSEAMPPVVEPPVVEPSVVKRPVVPVLSPSVTWPVVSLVAAVVSPVATAVLEPLPEPSVVVVEPGPVDPGPVDPGPVDPVVPPPPPSSPHARVRTSSTDEIDRIRMAAIMQHAAGPSDRKNRVQRRRARGPARPRALVGTPSAMLEPALARSPP
jgi:hypothetical protein